MWWRPRIAPKSSRFVIRTQCPIGRTNELDQVISWLTGFDDAELRHRVRSTGRVGHGSARAEDPVPRQAGRRARQGGTSMEKVLRASPATPAAFQAATQRALASRPRDLDRVTLVPETTRNSRTDAKVGHLSHAAGYRSSPTSGRPDEFPICKPTGGGARRRWWRGAQSAPPGGRAGGRTPPTGVGFAR